MSDIQSTLDDYVKQSDTRTSVFEVEIQGLKNKTLTLGGRLLDESQLDDLARLFPHLKLDTSTIRVLSRESPGHFHVATNLTGLYERPTFSVPLSSELYYGTKLEILEEEKNWVFARQRDGYLGWVYRPYLKEGTAPKSTHLVTVPAMELRAEPSRSGEITTRIVSGTAVVEEESRDGWSCVAANRSGWMPSAYLRSLAELPTSIEKQRETILQDARRMIGTPYLWGGTSGNGIDCSGFTRLLHRWVGIGIPRDADMQQAAAKPVEPPFEAGDLLFFTEKDSHRKITHVGVSLGGWTMIHASRGNNGIYIDDVQQRESLMNNFVSAGSFLR
jgi:gamma-D-glutamyl-L-lysine dipeptidyl-peptidase